MYLLPWQTPNQGGAFWKNSQRRTITTKSKKISPKCLQCPESASESTDEKHVACFILFTLHAPYFPNIYWAYLKIAYGSCVNNIIIRADVDVFNTTSISSIQISSINIKETGCM